ncbi:uncharacterized protein O3C94_023100 [Discoglossus pictus]
MTLSQGRPFFCREWALQRLQHCLEGLGGAQTPGILITGSPGAGKTTLCREILWPTSEAGHCSRLSSRVLAYHFCQAHAHASLCPRQFIQNLVQQLRKSSLINGYKLEVEPASCQGDLDEVFKRKVLLPLMALPPPSQNLLLLVDSLDETCCCCHSEGFPRESDGSIAELLANHHELLPPWLLLVCSTRRRSKAVTRMFTGFRRLCLDDLRKAHVVRDVQQYILYRLDREETLRQHLTIDTAEMLNQLHIKSNGCFLYLEKVLDGVSEGSIVLREIRHIPGTLNGLYLWLCQRLFSGRQFSQVQTLLNVLLASPRPLSASELHRAVWTKQMKGWSTEDFNKTLVSVSGLLMPQSISQNLLVPFHHSFSEWLLDVKYCTQKYLCNVAEGHSMLAMSLSAQAPSLDPAEVHQLARHLLMSDIRGIEPAHLALWLLLTGAPVSDCLTCNLPLELDVLQLLLLAGADLDGSCNLVDSGALRRTLDRGGSVASLLENGTGMNQRDRAGRTMLAAAAHTGNLEAVGLLLSRGADIEAVDEDGQTPLGLAAHQGHLSVLQLLLHHGAQPDHTDSRGWTPLRSAAWGGHTEVVEALLESEAQPDICGPDGRTALRAAAWGGHEGPVKALLKAGAQADLTDSEGRTPLMAAAYMGHRAVAELLLKAGAEVNKFDSERRTALAVACLCVPAGREYPDLISLLLEHGANPELQDIDGMTPLLVAAFEGQAEVAELLLEAGADPDTVGRGRMTPLLAAASGGHAETVRVLLLWGATTDITDIEGRSALGMAAAAVGGEEAVRVLLDRGLNENHRDQLGWTPLHWAACEGRRSSCRSLIEGGAKVGVRDNEGFTPLLLASQEGHTGCVELLLNRGARIDQQASDGRTGLGLAAVGGHKGSVELLLRRGANPNIKDKQGRPLLYLLSLEGLMEMAELLLEHSADTESRDADERTALHASCWQGDMDMARLLLVKGQAEPNAFDKDGRTPLHCAAWRGHASIASLLLQNGAFPDAQSSQGATPLCIAAQEGHEELARVLLEEGKASPHHADNYGRTPIRIAGKVGHIELVHLLESYGAPPYQGHFGPPPEKRTIEKGTLEETVEGAGGSWSTLSPVSTGSRSLNNSLKSSQGSVLTSSTYHSVATVPMDSLTFTQQVQQHSLPRSRSRQAIVLSGMLSCQERLTGSPTTHQTTSSLMGLDRWDIGNNQYPNSPDRELKRNCILTNPKYGSPKYTHYKTNDSGYSQDKTTFFVSSPSKMPDHGFIQHKTSSSGYSSSRTGNHKTHSPGYNHKKTQVPMYSPKKNEGPADSPKKIGESVDSDKKIMSPVFSSKNSGHVKSPRKNVDYVYSPKKTGEHVYSPNKISDPVFTSKKSGDPIPSPKKTEDSLYLPNKKIIKSKSTINPISFHKKIGDPVSSPTKTGDSGHSPNKNIVDSVYSPKKNGGFSPKESGDGSFSSHHDGSNKAESPVISINTMDPQLHLKQAIKLQFEGRTCGFNYRKETPL